MVLVEARNEGFGSWISEREVPHFGIIVTRLHRGAEEREVGQELSLKCRSGALDKRQCVIGQERTI